MPSTLLIDEPELGLHPYAITVLAAQLKAVSERHQVIVSTQSVELVNEFEADDLVVVNRQNGETTFERTSEDKLKSWLEDYSLGEIWKKNIIGGRTVEMIRLNIVVEGQTEEAFVNEILQEHLQRLGIYCNPDFTPHQQNRQRWCNHVCQN